MKTNPPCYRDGQDCPKRYVGCRAWCDPWQEYLAAHEKEMEEKRKAIAHRDDVNAFMAGQTKRARIARQIRYNDKREGRIIDHD